MKKYRLILFFILCCYHISAQERTIKGVLLSLGTHEPVPYGSLLSLTNKSHGTISDERGQFLLKVDVGENIFVSSIGYRDTIWISDMSDFIKLYLREEPIQLEGLTITETRSREFIFGDTTSPAKIQNVYEGTNVTQSGAGVGNVFNTKEISGYIKSISFFINPQKKTSYVVSLFSLDKEFKDYLLHPEDMLILLNKKVIRIDASFVGWATVDIIDQSIPIPKAKLVVLVTQLPDAETNLYRHKVMNTSFRGDYIMYEYDIVQQRKQRKGVRHFYQLGNQVAALSDKDSAIAMYVRCVE